MNDTPRIETPPTRHRRWRVLLTFALLLLLTLAAAIIWQSSRSALSDEERHLVGRWKYQWDHDPKDLGLEYEFRADRTCRIRNFDPKTGAVLVDSSTARWWLSGNKLIVRHPEVLTNSNWRLLPSQRAMYEESILTPDGPDRFRYKVVSEVHRSVQQGPQVVAGTMSRVTATE